MPPYLALLAGATFSALLLVREQRGALNVSSALWLPVVWIFFISSRFPGQWLDVFGIGGGGLSSPEDGSPIDAAFFLSLTLAGAAVLVRRGVRPGSLAAHNVWLAAFFLYSFIAITWSDFPFVAFKRWIKALGHPVMALIVLTELNRLEALRSVMKRAAYLHIPLSVVAIKYFPAIGRGFDPWTGAAMNNGISLNKNELGYVCMVFGLAMFWNLLCARRQTQSRSTRVEVFVSVVLLVMISWLFSMAASATSLACTAVGGLVMVGVTRRIVKRELLWVYALALVLAIGMAESVFGVYGKAVEALGRDVSLTDRTKIWADVFTIDINPLLGAGFESFWLGPRLEAMWDKWWWQPNQAHNGYIETYLNLGWIGVALLCGLLGATFWKGQTELQSNLDTGRFRIAFLVVILLYNYTEATFKGVHLLWTVFHLIAIDYGLPRERQAATVMNASRSSAAPRALARTRFGTPSRAASPRA